MTVRLPRTKYFSGGYVRFMMVEGKPTYMIFTQLLEEPKPIYEAEGEYTGQDLNALTEFYKQDQPFKRILK